MVEELADIEIERLNRRLSKHHCCLALTKETRRVLAEKGFDRQYGARALRRVIRSEVEVPFAEYLLSGAHDPAAYASAPQTYEVRRQGAHMEFHRLGEQDSK